MCFNTPDKSCTLIATSTAEGRCLKNWIRRFSWVPCHLCPCFVVYPDQHGLFLRGFSITQIFSKIDYIHNTDPDNV